METERRQKLNVTAIRVSLRSSMRDLTAEETRRTLERANLLLDQTDSTNAEARRRADSGRDRRAPGRAGPSSRSDA